MATTNPRMQLQIGRHLGYFEPPDLLWLEFHGDVSPAQVLEYSAKRAQLLQGQPHILTLLDVRDLRSPPPEVRAAIARLNDPRPQASAVIGARFQTKVMAELIVKAIYLFSGKQIELAFFASPEPAHAWLVEKRATI